MNGILGGFVHSCSDLLFVLTGNGAVWVYEVIDPRNFKFMYLC